MGRNDRRGEMECLISSSIVDIRRINMIELISGKKNDIWHNAEADIL